MDKKIIEKRKIEDFVLVVDNFGPMEIWSLQHPTKEIKDCFMIYTILDTKKKDWPDWMKKLYKIEKYCKKLSKDLADVDAYISGNVEYSNTYDGEKSRHVVSLDIKLVDIRGWYPV